MRAMQLVSASKLKRTQVKLLRSREVMQFLDDLLQRVLAASADLSHPLCVSRKEGPCALVLFTSDAGLSGSYNTRLIQLAEAHLRRDSLSPTQLYFIGKKGYRYFTKRGFAATQAYTDLAGRFEPKKTLPIAQDLMDRFLSGKLAAIEFLYCRFVSAAVYHPTIVSWLPIQFSRQHVADSTQKISNQRSTISEPTEYIFEPSPQAIFEDLLPRWAMAKFQCILLEAFTSEHSARMIAMKNATENAQEILKTLTMQRNKIRQASITKELSEIVGTAEALKE